MYVEYVLPYKAYFNGIEQVMMNKCIINVEKYSCRDLDS